VVVVGGGIAGLAAAYRLVERAPGVEVVLVEQSGRLGGKLRTVEVAGGPAEAGAEMFAVRDPDGAPSAAVGLAHALGLAQELVHPATIQAGLALAGAVRPIPAGTLMGVPAHAGQLDGVAAVDAVADRDGGAALLGPGEDVAVGALVRRRLGDEVADRLVDPLLGGVYAGRADDLSLATTIPALAAACRSGSTLTGAVRAVLAARALQPAGPIFATLTGGMGRLVDAVVARLAMAGVRVRLGSPVRGLAAVRATAGERAAGPAVYAALSTAPAAAGARAATPPGPGERRWRLVLGDTRAPELLDADAVVLATPGRPAARLLSDVDGAAAGALGLLDYASVALVTLVLPEIAVPALSGVLVPATQGYTVKAVTFVDRKWAHAKREGSTLVRASIGRYGEEHVLQRDDTDLVRLAVTELGQLLGGAVAAPREAWVWRWGGALPQYPPGHLGRVVAARAVLPATLALAGAGYDGVGIAACIRSGWAAADQVLAGLEHWVP